jgi:hypothetical protein
VAIFTGHFKTSGSLIYGLYFLPYKPGALRPAECATFEALMCFYLSPFRRRQGKLTQGTGYFLRDKIIAPLLLTGRGLLPPGKANRGVSSWDSYSCHQQAAKCKTIAAAQSSS